MRGRGLIAAVAAALGATTASLMQPSLTGVVPPAWVALAVSLGAVAGVAAALGLPAREEVAALGRARLAAAALTGAAALAGAPMLVMANRYTHAPSSAEALFLTTAAWGAIAVAAGVAAGRPGGRAVSLAGAFSALVACAALVASWEFPSSFSPFVRLPREQAMMLVAGVGWAAFALVVACAPAARMRACAWAGALVAAAAALAAALLGGGAREAIAEAGALAAYAAASAVFVGGWVALLAMAGVARAGAALFCPPLLVSVLSLVTAQQVGGGQPMLLGRAAAALALGAVSAAAVALPAPAPGRRPWARVAAAGAAICSAMAVAGLLEGTVKGAVVTHATTGTLSYRASWTLAGWESAGGWLAVAAAAWLAAAVFETARPLVAGAVTALVYPVLRAVPLHTWTTWMPASVQQDFGTEYARLTFAPLPARVQAATVAVAVAGLATVSAARALGKKRTEEVEGR